MMKLSVVVTALLAAAMILCTSAGCRRKNVVVNDDLSNPRSASIVFTRALESGDVETAKSAAYAGGIEVEWVEAMTRAVSGMKDLVKAAEAKFGPEAQSLITDKATLQMSAGLDAAEVQLSGDRATVVPADERMKIPLKRVEGKWKIDVGTLTRGADISSMVKQLRAVGELAPQLTKDVEAGKFKTVKDIRLAMGRGVAEAVWGIKPATAPAETQPVELMPEPF